MFWAWRIPKGALMGAIALLAVAASAVSFADRPFEINLVTRTILPMGAIAFRATREIAQARVAVEPPAPAATRVDGNRIELTPRDPLRPGAGYTVLIEAEDKAGTSLRRSFILRVEPAGDALWVYVKLDAPSHTVHVFRGDTLVRTMIASGGRPGFETPQGVFRIQNRGFHFFSQKYQEGAYFWVRIFGNYLFHSVPVDIEGNVIEEEAERLGCPASHGCVRLSFSDAKWFYENVPDGTLVVIDGT